MIYRSKAPLRIGLAGGGTDVSPYSDEFGGAILNVTISLFAYANIEKNKTKKIHLIAQDRNESEDYVFEKQLPINGHLDLLKGVYNRIQKDFGKIDFGFTLTTFVDAPAGSGLGTSSTLVVAILGAFIEMLELKLNQYEIAMYAYKIEREDLKLAGGKQDQYATTFGGVNFMEFFKDDKVIVNPLRIQGSYMQELENNLILFYTDSSRESAHIIEEQQKNVHDKKSSSIEAMHQLKSQANLMKEALLQGKLDKIGEILDFGFQQKRLMAENISNETIEKIYHLAKNAGASGGKISGAGGGGFMIFYCPENTKFSVIKALSKINGRHRHYQFTKNGLRTWRSVS
ncbi:MAG: dehydrogenase [Chitinophagaceae bacterium]|nr:dehydrogenase [Chitinophagaceae bacterium]